MTARVFADPDLLPIGRRAVRVVSLQRLRIVDALVTEDLPEGFERAGARRQHQPEVVPDFVPTMPEQRPVLFADHFTTPRPLDIVAFGNVERDHAGLVPSDHRFLGTCRQQMELQLRGTGKRWVERKSQLEQAVNHPLFRSLDPLPACSVGIAAEVRNLRRQAAGTTERSSVGRINQPEASVIITAIGTMPRTYRACLWHQHPNRAVRLWIDREHQRSRR